VVRLQSIIVVNYSFETCAGQATPDSGVNLTMSDDGKIKYVWVVEWENPFSQQNKKGMVFYDVTLLPGVKEEDFLKFLTEEAFLAVDGIRTRAIRFTQQYLLRYSEKDGPDPLRMIQKEGVEEKLESLCIRRVDKNFHIVMAPPISRE
jgi:hypothetical protein